LLKQCLGKSQIGLGGGPGRELRFGLDDSEGGALEGRSNGSRKYDFAEPTSQELWPKHCDFQILKLGLAHPIVAQLWQF
jgi:hypothetical protein